MQAAVRVVLDGQAEDPVVDVVAGATHSCALRWSGELWCWGLLEDGFDGVGTLHSSSEPQLVDASLGVALVNDEIWCWGANQDGPLGGPPGGASAVPVRVDVPCPG